MLANVVFVDSASIRANPDMCVPTDLFLRPAEAKAELDMKIGAQKRELER